MLTNKKLNLVISILAAIAIWVYVTAFINPDDTRTIEGVRVELRGLDALAADGLIVTNDSYAIDVTVAGSRSDLSALDAEDFTAIANVKGFSLGKNPATVQVTVNTSRVKVKGLKPDRIEVNIEELVSVAKPIILSYSKKFPKGMEPGFVTLSPHEIDVSGTKNAVGGVAYVTAEINSDALKEEETMITANIEPSNKNGDRVFDVSLSQNTIDVTATLCHVKEVPFKVDIQGELDAGLTITKENIPPTVSIRGSEEALADVTELWARPIDLSDLEETSIINPDLLLPAGVELADDSSNFTVTFEIGGVKTKEFTFTADQIEVTGVKDGYTAHVNTGTITVTVFGTEKQIANLTAANLSIYIDLKNIDFGAEFVDVKVLFKHKKKFVRIESNPAEVRVIITKMPANTPTSPSASAIINSDMGTGIGIE